MKKSLKKILYQIKLKILIYWKLILISIIQFSCIFAFAWFENCLLEMCIIVACFFIFRRNFEKQYHAKNGWICTLYTIILFFIISNISPNITTSILIIIIFTYFINLFLYYAKDYLDLKNKFQAKKIGITKGMSEDDLKSIIENEDINELEYNILRDYYVKRYKLNKIAIKYDYSIDNINKIKAKAIKKLTKK